MSNIYFVQREEEHDENDAIFLVP